MIIQYLIKNYIIPLFISKLKPRNYMKLAKPYLFLFIGVISIVISCKKKEPVTKEVKFSSTHYKSLGSFSSEWEPDYLVTPDPYSADVHDIY